jgi:hypothetical protein
VKRLMIVLAVAAAAFCTPALGAATAKAADEGGWAVTLKVSPTTVPMDEYFNLSGALTHNGGIEGVADQEIDIHIYLNAGCAAIYDTGHYYYTYAAEDGSYGGDVSLYEDFGFVTGTHSFQAESNGATSECQSLTVTDPSWTLSLDVTPATITMDQTAVASGFLKPAVTGEDVYVEVYAGEGCSSDNWLYGYMRNMTTESDGSYAYVIDPADFAEGLGTYSLQADAGDVDMVSSCETLTIAETAPAPPPPTPTVEQQAENGVFLCYSKWQVDPGVWPWSEAKKLMEGGGYWMPYAVPGNVDFGTNIGDYHLVCNIAATQSVSGSMLGAGEDVYSPDIAKAAIGDMFGPFYPVVGGG